MSATIIRPAMFCGDHEWQEVYYGYACRYCDAFVPFGCEPWVDVDQEQYSEMEDFNDYGDDD